MIWAALSAHAQEAPVEVDIPAQPLGDALQALGQQTPLQFLFAPDLIAGKHSTAAHGWMTPDAALDAVLDGSGIEFHRSGNSVTLLRSGAPDRPELLAPEVRVEAAAQHFSGGLAAPFAGGQVAGGGQVGILGTLEVLETPFSTSNYTAELIENQQARGVGDVMANDASVRPFYAQNFVQDGLFIRGFSVLSDDFQYGGLYGVLPSLRTSTQIAERVEVLRGPNAFLNGMAPTGAIGGGINLVPKRAGDTALTQVSATFASTSQLGAEIDLGRRFGEDHRFGVRFNGVMRGGDTAVEDSSEQLGLGLVGLDFRGERVRIALDLGYQQADLDGIENGLFGLVGADVPDPPDARDRYFQPWLYDDVDDTFGALRAEVDIAPAWTIFAAGGGAHSNLQELYAFGQNLDVQGNFEEVFGFNAQYFETRTGQAGIRGHLQTGSVGHQLVLSGTQFRQERGYVYRFGVAEGGIDPIASNIYTPTFIAQPPLAPAPEDIPKTSETVLSSIALADTLSFAQDRLLLTLGARYQHVQTESFDGTTGATIDDYDEEALTPALGIVYRARPNVSLYANYIEGLGVGPVAPPGTINAGQVFPPTRSEQYEIGAKWEAGKLGATVAAFQISRPSELTVNNVFSVSGEQRNRGLELNVFGEATKGVRVLGGVMFLEGRLVRTEDSANDGNRAPDTAPVNVNLGAEWDMPFWPGFTLTGRVIYTSSQYIDQANTQQIPAWTRFDVGARYLFYAGAWPVTLRANIENVANSSYWVNSSLFRGAPLTVLLSATVDF